MPHGVCYKIHYKFKEYLWQKQISPRHNKALVQMPLTWSLFPGHQSRLAIYRLSGLRIRFYQPNPKGFFILLPPDRATFPPSCSCVPQVEIFPFVSSQPPIKSIGQSHSIMWKATANGDPLTSELFENFSKIRKKGKHFL